MNFFLIAKKVLPASLITAAKRFRNILDSATRTPHHCPVCGNNFYRFIAFFSDSKVTQTADIVGGQSDMNAKCPVCASYPRTRLLWCYLTQSGLSEQLSAMSVLHIAPERGLYKRLSKLSKKYVCCDLHGDSQHYRFATEIENQDLQLLSYKNESFDLVICSHVLEHVPDDKAAMREIFRILKPGACAFLMVPYGRTMKDTLEDKEVTIPSDRKKIFGQTDHVRLYSRADFTARLKQLGYEVQTARPALNNDEEIKMGCADKDECIFFALRPHA